MKPHRYFTPREWHAFPFLAKTHPLPRKEGNLQSGHQPDYTTRVKPLSLWSLLLSINPACASQTLSLAPTQHSLLAVPCHSAASRTPKRAQALLGKKCEPRNLSAEPGKVPGAWPSPAAPAELQPSGARRGGAQRSPATAPSPFPFPFSPGGTPPAPPPPSAAPTGGRHGAGGRGRGRSRCPAGGSARGRPSRGRFLGPAGGCLCPPRPDSAAPAPAPGRGFGARCCRAPVCQVLRGSSGMLRERALPAAPLRGEKGERAGGRGVVRARRRSEVEERRREHSKQAVSTARCPNSDLLRSTGLRSCLRAEKMGSRKAPLEFAAQPVPETNHQGLPR